MAAQAKLGGVANFMFYSPLQKPKAEPLAVETVDGTVTDSTAFAATETENTADERQMEDGETASVAIPLSLCQNQKEYLGDGQYSRTKTVKGI